ncbi:MAG: flagellar hook capping protein [Firmicutes bacterium]|nr:flagellar hook capping protein [Bacillota bacterium]
MSTKLTDGTWLNTTNGVANNSTTKVAKTTSGSSMGKDEFLQLLVTQTKYQDPLDPQSNSEYASQLAQYSSLEQMQNLNTTTNSSQANSLVGKYVAWADSKGNTFTGTVSSVKYSDGTAKLMVGSTEVGLSSLIYVGGDVSQSNTSDQIQDLNTVQASVLIGKKVSWTDSTGASHNGTVTSVKVTSGEAQLMIGSTAVSISDVTNIETA